MKKILIFIIITFFLTSCAPQEKPLTLNEAHQKFITLCQEEYKFDVKVFPLKNTIWIYLPTDKLFYDYKATEPKPVAEKKAEDKFKVNFLDVQFENNSFVVSYDISKIKQYPSKDPGYASNNSEDFSQKYRGIFTAILRAYFDVKETETASFAFDRELKATPPQKIQAYIKKSGIPEFFVIVIADIKTGLKVEYIANLEDYKKYANNALPYEEYSQRLIYQMTGDIGLTNDAEGKNLKTREITWSEFLTKQIINRINFKYGQSQFTPSENVEKEITQAIGETIIFYDFDDFDAAILKNLGQDKTQTIQKSQIKESVSKETDPSRGRFHVIQFLNK